MKKLVIVLGIGVLLIVGAGAFFLYAPAKTQACDAVEAVESATITFANGQFSPSCTVITSKGTITWVNNDDKTIEVGVDPHPAHTGNKEVSGGEFVLRLAPGEKETITVNKKGTFGYHDHTSPFLRGSIIVQ